MREIIKKDRREQRRKRKKERGYEKERGKEKEKSLIFLIDNASF